MSRKHADGLKECKRIMKLLKEQADAGALQRARRGGGGLAGLAVTVQPAP